MKERSHSKEQSNISFEISPFDAKVFAAKVFLESGESELTQTHVLDQIEQI